MYDFAGTSKVRCRVIMGKVGQHILSCGGIGTLGNIGFILGFGNGYCVALLYFSGPLRLISWSWLSAYCLRDMGNGGSHSVYEV